MKGGGKEGREEEKKQGHEEGGERRNKGRQEQERKEGRKERRKLLLLQPRWSSLSPFIHSSDMTWKLSAVVHSCSWGCLSASSVCNMGNWLCSFSSRDSSLLMS